MAAIAAYRLNAAFTAHQHAVPCRHGFVAQRRAEAPIKIRHHFGDAALGRRDAPVVGSEPELVAQRGLHAVAVEDFALDLRGLHGFFADQLDLEAVLVVRSDMLQDPQNFAGPQQELPLERLQGGGIVGECGPAQLLPIPGHEL
jgi:hypothetical protein